ncbi:hypothetical protein AVEN_127017-1 [Araneus ventricosus]|uniref:Uncharacterized protein n=1 Tax=Araneus ventricosus TaxID=182803 RepID=A0A4Y2C088_ARAVE|nr:hypothetical protein AVEN_127017-1 [Araneus ventricosus]
MNRRIVGLIAGVFLTLFQAKHKYGPITHEIPSGKTSSQYIGAKTDLYYRCPKVAFSSRRPQTFPLSRVFDSWTRLDVLDIVEFELPPLSIVNFNHLI